MEVDGQVRPTERFVALVSASVHARSLEGTLTVLAANNLAIAASALLLAACLSVAAAHPALYVASLLASILFCAAARSAGEGEKLSFTKDWIVVMNDQEEAESGRSGGLSSELSAGHSTSRLQTRTQ